LPATGATEFLTAELVGSSPLEANGMISHSWEADRVLAAASDAKNICCVSASKEGENKRLTI